MDRNVADRDLLFGLLALQNNFLSREDLLGAFNVWVVDKSHGLAHILVEQQKLRPEVRDLLAALVEEHLRQHGNAPERSLAALSSIGGVRADLAALGDADLAASLVRLPPADHAQRPDPFAATMCVGSRTSNGQEAGLRFRILRPHARGGLGEVYVARDEELGREVALKEIRLEHAHEPDARDRFLREAEITGQLEHPGIVPVYGLGTYADGRPFYAMRFIKGDSLKAAVVEFHKDRAPATRLAGERMVRFRQLLGRFIDVCHAMHYAHSRHVLHRDLKPDNIMLGKYGETLVVDWGLAKAASAGEGSVDAERPVTHHASGSASQTLDGSALGTPEYMSPEQAAGRLDDLGPATDIYALGATLYAILTGVAPFDRREELPTVLRAVQSGQFDPPRAKWPAIPPALEAICLRAMALTTSARYGTAQEIADDVERWLADEPLPHLREPWATRARRQLRKHPALAAAALASSLVVFVAAIAVALLVGSHNRQLAQTNRDLESARRTADSKRAEADSKRQEAELVTGFLISAFRGFDPEADGRSLTVAALVRQTIQALDTRPLPAATRLEIQAALRQTCHGLGMFDEETQLCEKIVATQRRMIGPEHPDTLLSMNNLGAAYFHAGRYQEAIPLLEGTLARQRAALPANDPDALNTMGNLANALQMAGRYDEAMKLHESTYQLKVKELGADDPSTLKSMKNLATALLTAGRKDEALPLFEQVLARRRTVLGPQHADTLASANSLASAYQAIDRLDKAMPLFEETFVARRAKLGSHHPDTLVSLNNFALALQQGGRADLALPHYEEAVQALQDKLGKQHPLTLTTLDNLGVAYRAVQRYDESVARHQLCLKLRQNKLGLAHRDTLISMHHLAESYRSAGRLPEAQTTCEAAWQLARENLPPGHAVTLAIMDNLAATYRAAGRATDAERIEQELHALRLPPPSAVK